MSHTHTPDGRLMPSNHTVGCQFFPNFFHNILFSNSFIMLAGRCGWMRRLLGWIETALNKILRSAINAKHAAAHLFDTTVWSYLCLGVNAPTDASMWICEYIITLHLFIALPVFDLKQTFACISYCDYLLFICLFMWLLWLEDDKRNLKLVCWHSFNLECVYDTTARDTLPHMRMFVSKRRLEKSHCSFFFLRLSFSHFCDK